MAILTWLYGIAGTVQNGYDAPQRAQQLADVAGAVYEARARGSGIYLPLEPTHPLLSVIKQALAKETDSHTGQRLAAALLDNILQAVDAAQGSQEADSFPDLLVGPLLTTQMLVYLTVNWGSRCCH